MRRLLIGIAIALLVALGGAASAEPMLTGPTGLILIPTADTLGLAQWNVGGANVWTSGGADASALYGNVGLLPGLEVGFSREKLEGADANTLINAKYRLIGLPGKVTVAVGVVDLTDQVDVSAYVVGSHDLGAGVFSPRGRITNPRVHVGLGGRRLDGLFAGLSATVGDATDAMIEYDGSDLNLGVRWSPMRKVSITVAALDGLDNLAAGLSVSSPW